MDSVRILLALIDAAIHAKPAPHESYGLDADEWKKVLGAAAAHNVHTLIYDALPDDVPAEVMRIWSGQVKSVERINERIAKVASLQEAAWKKCGLSYAMLKGLDIADMYHNPGHRGCGDIDWYFSDVSSWNSALEMAERNSSEGVTVDSDGDVNYIWNDVVIEHHRDWTNLSGRRLRTIAGKTHPDNGRLCPGDCLLMLNCHILHHVSTSGVGLKQLADLAVAYEHYRGAYDVDAFAARLKRLGLLRWTALLHAALIELTAVDASVLPVRASLQRNDVDRLMRLILEDGNFGLSRKRRFDNMTSRIMLLMKYCPGEVCARYAHLLAGKLRKGFR